MKWSLSQISTFERCGFKYVLQYHAATAAPIIGLTSIPERTPPPVKAQRGIDLHKGIELHLTQKHPLPPELIRWTFALSDIQQYPHFPEHKVALNKAWEPVPYSSPDAWLRSILDLKVLKPNLLCVYDWKTGKEYPEHYDQKTLYSIAALAEHPEYYEVNAVHVYLDDGRQVPRTYHKDQLHAFRTQWFARVQKMEHAVDSLIYAKSKNDVLVAFPMQPNTFCKWCDFRKSNGGPCRFS